MADPTRTRFIKYFPLLLDALRTKDPSPMRPAEAMAWIRQHADVPAEDLQRKIENGSQSIFENDVHWGRFYLVKAGMISKARRGLWSLTPRGLEARLDRDQAWKLYLSVRDGGPEAPVIDTERSPAPEASEGEEERAFWFVGAVWGKSGEQMARFRAEGIWENGYSDQYSDFVRRMKAGDRIAVKSSFVQKHDVPFDVGGKPVSVMRIKQTGTILEGSRDGRRVKVAWDPSGAPRDWYFYTYRKTIAEADRETEAARRLIEFTFDGAGQDYAWWLAQPYWVAKYGVTQLVTAPPPPPSGSTLGELEEESEETTYCLDDIIEEGCFLARSELQAIVDRWTQKKNLILQGPPGTGKTWLAKRLGFALVGSNDRETARSRLRVIQFHPSLAYEDFVRGWRPTIEKSLGLVDGIMMQAIDAAVSEPDRPFVLVIEEINRGNPAQIFGEMLTLLESTKRRRDEAMELAYRKEPGERVYVPDNLYVIGTMNVADRSLALVDLALRRRFAFVDLQPCFGPAWQGWCLAHGIDAETCTAIQTRIEALNAEISVAASLGAQFRIGHSFVTPDRDEVIADGRAWFRNKVETEIGPLLEEYWYESVETARKAKAKLLVGI